MSFEWDSKKAASNIRKHKIDFADAATIFDDDRALTIEDDHPDEERFITLGLDGLARVLVVSWTWRDETIRLISARRATPKEQEQYLKTL